EGGAGHSRIFRLALREVLGRLGALADHAVGEPSRPPAPVRGPRVSVVVPTVDQRALLQACLESLREQTYGELEVLVVDGGSQDGSQAVARDVLPGVRVVDLPGNPGFAHACNLGARLASGEHVVVLNDDTRLAPDAIAQLM